MRKNGWRPAFGLGLILAIIAAFGPAACTSGKNATLDRAYNGPYEGPHLNRVAFPIGGIGAGMFCLEGTGAVSHVSVRNVLKFFNEPCTFAAITVKGDENVARVLEGPVPGWKLFGAAGTGNGASGTSYGLPRFGKASFLARFPFATIALDDPAVPLDVTLTGWSPFIPGDADDSSLPVGSLEYAFHNPTSAPLEAVFSFNTKNFMAAGSKRDGIGPIKGGFVLYD
ncbi:MAG: GH116 family glycosyl-hydrolase, partial [Candidatus Aminicenantes bacterium]